MGPDEFRWELAQSEQKRGRSRGEVLATRNELGKVVDLKESGDLSFQLFSSYEFAEKWSDQSSRTSTSSVSTDAPSARRGGKAAADLRVGGFAEKRKAEAERIRQKYPDRIPVSRAASACGQR